MGGGGQQRKRVASLVSTVDSRTSKARTPLEPRKYVRGMGSSS